MPMYLFAPADQVLKWLISLPTHAWRQKIIPVINVSTKMQTPYQLLAPKLTQSMEPFKYKQHPGNLTSFKVITMPSSNRLSKKHTAERLVTPHSFGYYRCKHLLPACHTTWINRQVSMKLQILEVFPGTGWVGNRLDGFLWFQTVCILPNKTGQALKGAKDQSNLQESEN